MDLDAELEPLTATAVRKGARQMHQLRNPKFTLGMAILGLTCVAAVSGPWVGAGLAGAGTEPEYAWMSHAELEDFEAFELYWLGEEFDGLERYATVRQVEVGTVEEPRGRDSVDFLHGDCDASRGSCPFPLEVQVWPACVRSLSSYELAPGVPYPHEALQVRGVPAARFDDGHRLELYTGAVTVVIFGDSPERVLKAARGLRGLGAATDADGGALAGDRLAAPVQGALDGTLSCDGA